MNRVHAFVDHTSGRATARYGLTLGQSGSPVRRDGHSAVQVENYRRYQEHQFAFDLRVRQLLGDACAPQVHLFAYLNFARQVDRACRTQSGPDRDRVALVAVLQNEARGLARELLLSICRDVFELDPARYLPRGVAGEPDADKSRPVDGLGPEPRNGVQSAAGRD